MTADLAVVIVTYNSADYIEACLDSVARIDDGLAVDTIVFDNASTDDTVEVAQRLAAAASGPVSVVANEINLGFGRAVNRGVDATDAPYVLLLNPDAELTPGSAERLLALARRRPQHGFYGGLTRRLDGSLNEHTLRKLPSVLGAVTFGTGLSALVPALGAERLPLPDDVTTAPMVTASLLLVERAVWDELGGFDERFFMYSEDADLCRRAVDRGYVPLVDPHSVVNHDGGASTPDTGRKIAMMMAGRATYIRRHWTGPARALALCSLLSGVALRAALGRVTGTTAWGAAWRLRRWWFPGYRPGQPEVPPSS